MATQAAFQEQYTRLNGLIQRWDRRYRLQQMIYWLPRSLLPGLVAGLCLFVAARFVRLLPTPQLATLTAGAVIIGLLVMLAVIWLRPRSTLVSARRFDRWFDLRETTSTALELIEGRIQSTSELTSYQIDDAWSRGQTVDTRRHLPLKPDSRAWMAVVALFALLVIIAILPNPQDPVDTQMAARQAAVDEAASDVERITEDIASNTTLSDEERQNLLQQLDRTRDTLDSQEVTPEEAFASLSDSQSQLEQQAERLNGQVQQQQSALQDAAQYLQNAGADTQTSSNSSQEAQDAAQEMQRQLQQDLQGMSQQQRQQLAAAMDQAADQLAQTNPQAAQALRDAAEALRNNDLQTAQQNMQQAMQNIQQQDQQMLQQQQAAQDLQQNAQQLQQAASQIGQQSQQNQQGQQQQSGQSQNQQSQPGQPPNDSGVQSLQQNAQQQPGMQSVQPQNQGGQQQGQQGQQDQSGQTSGQAQPGDGSQQGQNGSQAFTQTGQDGQQQEPGAQNQQAGDAGGAGDLPGDAGQDGTSGQSRPATQDNNPDGQGVGQFDPVYAPRRVGGEGGPEVVLEPDNSNVPVQEGEFAQNPAGQSVVPYNQVYSDYSSQANRALDSDYIPLGLRDVVREYFSSLEPGQ